MQCSIFLWSEPQNSLKTIFPESNPFIKTLNLIFILNLFGVQMYKVFSLMISRWKLFLLAGDSVAYCLSIMLAVYGRS